jgi:tetratricopeptide (TPR) repeat protein
MGSRTVAKIDILSEKYRSNPNSLIFAQFADEYRKEGDISKAIEICLNGLESHPDYVTGRVILGRCYLEQNNTESAVQEFMSACSYDRRNQVAIKMLADIYSKQGSPDKAGNLYNYLYTMDPFNNNLAQICKQYPSDGQPIDLFNVIGLVLPEQSSMSSMQHDDGAANQSLDQIFPDDSYQSQNQQYVQQEILQAIEAPDAFGIPADEITNQIDTLFGTTQDDSFQSQPIEQPEMSGNMMDSGPAEFDTNQGISGNDVVDSMDNLFGGDEKTDITPLSIVSSTVSSPISEFPFDSNDLNFPGIDNGVEELGGMVSGDDMAARIDSIIEEPSGTQNLFDDSQELGGMDFGNHSEVEELSPSATISGDEVSDHIDSVFGADSNSLVPQNQALDPFSDPFTETMDGSGMLSGDDVMSRIDNLVPEQESTGAFVPQEDQYIEETADFPSDSIVEERTIFGEIIQHDESEQLSGDDVTAHIDTMIGIEPMSEAPESDPIEQADAITGNDISMKIESLTSGDGFAEETLYGVSNESLPGFDDSVTGDDISMQIENLSEGVGLAESTGLDLFGNETSSVEDTVTGDEVSDYINQFMGMDATGSDQQMIQIDEPVSDTTDMMEVSDDSSLNLLAGNTEAITGNDVADHLDSIFNDSETSPLTSVIQDTINSFGIHDIDNKTDTSMDITSSDNFSLDNFQNAETINLSNRSTDFNFPILEEDDLTAGGLVERSSPERDFMEKTQMLSKEDFLDKLNNGVTEDLSETGEADTNGFLFDEPEQAPQSGDLFSQPTVNFNNGTMDMPLEITDELSSDTVQDQSVIPDQKDFSATDVYLRPKSPEKSSRDHFTPFENTEFEETLQFDKSIIDKSRQQYENELNRTKLYTFPQGSSDQGELVDNEAKDALNDLTASFEKSDLISDGEDGIRSEQFENQSNQLITDSLQDDLVVESSEIVSGQSASETTPRFDEELILDIDNPWPNNAPDKIIDTIQQVPDETVISELDTLDSTQEMELVTGDEVAGTIDKMFTSDISEPNIEISETVITSEEIQNESGMFLNITESDSSIDIYGENEPPLNITEDLSMQIDENKYDSFNSTVSGPSESLTISRDQEMFRTPSDASEVDSLEIPDENDIAYSISDSTMPIRESQNDEVEELSLQDTMFKPLSQNSDVMESDTVVADISEEERNSLSIDEIDDSEINALGGPLSISGDDVSNRLDQMFSTDLFGGQSSDLIPDDDDKIVEEVSEFYTVSGDGAKSDTVDENLDGFANVEIEQQPFELSGNESDSEVTISDDESFNESGISMEDSSEITSEEPSLETQASSAIYDNDIFINKSTIYDTSTEKSEMQIQGIEPQNEEDNSIEEEVEERSADTSITDTVDTENSDEDTESGLLSEDHGEKTYSIPDHVLTPTLAEIYFQQGQLQLAKQIFSRLYNQDPENTKLGSRIEEINNMIRQGDASSSQTGQSKQIPVFPGESPAARLKKKIAENPSRPLSGVRIKKSKKPKKSE